MKKIQKGFTLIELMIVVAIIGILAAIAIPAYSDYIARAQVSEAVVLLESGKTPMAEFYADNGRWPMDAGSTIGNLHGKYFSDLSLTGGIGSTDSSALELTATMRLTNVSSLVAGDKITMTTQNGGKTWSCTGGDLIAKYRPAACR